MLLSVSPMKNFNYLPAVAALAVFASSAHSAQAADGVVLAKAGSFPKAGTKVTASRKMAMANGTLNIEVGGQKMDGTCKITETETESIEYKSADKVLHEVTAGEKSQAMKINGEEMPNQPAPPSLLKAPFTLTKADGKWTAKLDSGEDPSDDQKEELKKKEKSLNKPDDVPMYGTEPRKVGDTWTVDAADLPFADGDKETKGEVKLTFKAIEEYDGKKCAHLEGPMELTGKTDEEEGKDMSLKGTVVILRSLDDLMDLKMQFTGKMELKGAVPNGTMSMSGEMTMEETSKVSH